MIFDASRIQSPSKHISSAQREVDRANRLQRAVAEASRPSIMDGLLQNIAKPPVIAGIGSYQNIAGAGFARYHRDMRQVFGLPASPVMSAVQEVARSMGSYQAGLSENTPSRLAFSKRQAVNGFNLGALDSRVQSFNKITDLTQGLTRPYDLREGGFVSAFGSLDQLNRLTSPSVFSMVQGIQSKRTPPLTGQMAHAASEAARVYSGWKPLLDDFKEYRLRDVRTMPVPRGNAWADYAPAPERPDPAPPLEVPSATDQLREMPDTSIEEVPYQFGGGWRIFQPLENAAHRLMNGPLIVRLLFVDTRNVVVGVTIGGVLFLLFYSS